MWKLGIPRERPGFNFFNWIGEFSLPCTYLQLLLPQLRSLLLAVLTSRYQFLNQFCKQLKEALTHWGGRRKSAEAYIVGHRIKGNTSGQVLGRKERRKLQDCTKEYISLVMSREEYSSAYLESLCHSPWRKSLPGLGWVIWGVLWSTVLLRRIELGRSCPPKDKLLPIQG